MDTSVLTLGEKIVLAARLAAIEHVRQELDAAARSAEASEREVGGVGDAANGVTDDAGTETLSRPLPELLGEVLGKIVPARAETLRLPARAGKLPPPAKAVALRAPAKRRPRRKGAA